MNYTKEQLSEYCEHLEMFEPMKKVLRFLGANEESQFTMKEIGLETELSTYPRDKALLALEFSNFVIKKIVSASKVYRITEEGRKLLEVMEENNG